MLYMTSGPGPEWSNSRYFLDFKILVILTVIQRNENRNFNSDGNFLPAGFSDMWDTRAALTCCMERSSLGSISGRAAKAAII